MAYRSISFGSITTSTSSAYYVIETILSIKEEGIRVIKLHMNIKMAHLCHSSCCCCWRINTTHWPFWYSCGFLWHEFHLLLWCLILFQWHSKLMKLMWLLIQNISTLNNKIWWRRASSAVTRTSRSCCRHCPRRRRRLCGSAWLPSAPMSFSTSTWSSIL